MKAWAEDPPPVQRVVTVPRARVRIARWPGPVTVRRRRRDPQPLHLVDRAISGATILLAVGLAFVAGVLYHATGQPAMFGFAGAFGLVAVLAAAAWP